MKNIYVTREIQSDLDADECPPDAAFSTREAAERHILETKKMHIRGHWIKADTGEEMPQLKEDWLGGTQLGREPQTDAEWEQVFDDVLAEYIGFEISEVTLDRDWTY